jgi:AraC family transcriptional regulator
MLTQLTEGYAYPTGTPAAIIHRERTWYALPGSGVPKPRISVSRWSGQAPDRREFETQVAPDCHVLAVSLRPMEDLTCYADARLVQSGRLPQGSIRLNTPGLALRGIFREAYDVLHLHVPNAIVAEYGEAGCDQRRMSPAITGHTVIDPVIERLARSLIHADELGGAFGQSYAEGIGLAIIAQLFGGNSGAASTGGSRVSGLSKWRLKRAVDYMMANLAEPIGLGDIASAAGLSRMHFAAQFRVATGSRPHEYLVRLRIERAQDLLSTTRLALVEIALDVGFKSQAHFTTVFARLVGETPKVWRQRNDGSASDHVPVIEARMLKAA